MKVVRSLAGPVAAGITLPAETSETPARSLGIDPNPEEQAHLADALRTGRSTEVAREDIHGHCTLVFPARSRQAVLAAVMLRFAPRQSPDASTRDALQALTDQLGLHLERSHLERQTRQAEHEAEHERLRNTLLAAISHDYRTPLATIVGAASSLRDQADRLSRAQARALASTIVDEARQLAEITENTLQLARLDAPGVKLSLDWESCEELLGATADRAANRHPGRPVSVRIEPDLPLVHCDAVLLTQMLDNLVGNAMRHGAAAQTVELVARRAGGAVLLGVGDRGPGIARADRERVFLPFERGVAGQPEIDGRGMGVGLALCRAVAHAHNGELRLRERRRGGLFAECLLPVVQQPSTVGGPAEPARRPA